MGYLEQRVKKRAPLKVLSDHSYKLITNLLNFIFTEASFYN